MLYGAIEAGGTKMVVAVVEDTGEIKEKLTIPTTTPEETMPQIIDFLKDKAVKAVGVGSFGPVDVVEDSPTYGCIMNTPKLAWKNFDLVGALKDGLGLPVGLDTDVNAACLGEMTYGCAKGVKNVVYITIGTGIGAGIAVDGKLLHGMMHPEAGHIIIPKRLADRGQSVCPYHDSCFEGLASGPSIEARWGKKAYELVDNQVVWELESEYIAKGLMNMILTLSPQKIILGGGVMHQTQLFPLIREKVTELLNHYYDTRELADMDNYIVPASLNDNQGILGAAVLAMNV
ncbi:MAG: ROK family protein [Lachnospiraceae bacterium]|nr:ROK family protein [Lachnospiraceae bacterium]